MEPVRFNSRGSEWIGDMTVWIRENSEDNAEDLRRLKIGLAFAIERELSHRQRELLALYYEQGMNMPQIAAHFGINCSTVSRTILRAKRRLYNCLRYTSPTLLMAEFGGKNKGASR